MNELIVCPRCDAAYKIEQPKAGERAVCTRCHMALMAPRKDAGLYIIAVSSSVVVLIIAATIFPFLKIEVAGTQSAVSILDAALIFTSGPLVLLALATAALIIFIPLLRMLLLIYVIAPMVFDHAPLPGAMQAFRWSEILRPWSMAEIFALGCGVALVKIADMAQVTLGPAFWLFAILVILVVVQDSFMCRWSVWNALDQKKTS